MNRYIHLASFGPVVLIVILYFLDLLKVFICCKLERKEVIQQSCASLLMLIHSCFHLFWGLIVSVSAFERTLRKGRVRKLLNVDRGESWIWPYANRGFLMADSNLMNKITRFADVHVTNPIIGTED